MGESTDVPREEKLPGSLRLDTYRVVGPGIVLRGKDRYAPGDTLELTASDARSLGSAVQPADARDQDPPESRQAGKYEVVGPGCVFRDGKTYGAGVVLHLNAVDARSLGTHVRFRKG
jgi:hypothetical protein